MRRFSAYLTVFVLILLFAFSANVSAQGYYPEGNEIMCVNGTNRYTRALYGTHTAYRLETSDRPVFATYKKNNCHNIQLYLMYGGKDYPLDSIDNCTAYYQGGIRRYHIASADVDLTITATASMTDESALWRFEAKNLPKHTQFRAVLSKTRSSKFSRNGDLGVDDLTKFESDGNTISSVTWNAKGTTYLTLSNDTVLTCYQKGSRTDKLGLSASSLFENNLSAIKALTSRVTFSTPDPYFNPLGSVLMAAADGLWDGLEDENGTGTWQHGCIGWRTPLAGWRGCYVGDAVGWFDRSYHHFKAYANSQVTNVPPTIPSPTQDPDKALSRAEKRWGTQMYSNGYICRYPNRTNTMNHYDMNLNYIDGLLWHLSYDADTTQLCEFWPVLKLHLDWEKRNYDPDNDHLYDAYCCIWASDALYYNSGAVTHSSAYNYKGNRYAARIAEILHEPQSVIDHYKNEADSILLAMNKRLWLPKEGHWAEFQDFMGKKRLHHSAAIWTIYTPIDCGACTPEQAWEATAYVTREIPHIPLVNDDPAVKNYQTISTTNWMPYDWSTNNVAHEEVSNMALAYFQAGRGDEGFDLLKSDILDEMYQGRSPGNFGQISRYDAVLKEAYRDFGDNLGVTSRALINGLFGIHPDALNGKCYIQPAFPDSWDHASIHTPYLSYEYKKIGGRDSFIVEQHFPQHLEIVILPKYRGSGNDINIPSERQRVQSAEYLTAMGLDDITPDSESRQHLVDLTKNYNANVDDIFKNKYLTPRSPYTTLELPVQGIGQWCHPEKIATIEDDGLRSLITEDNIFDTRKGLSFMSPKSGQNIIYTSLWDNYPDSVDVAMPKGKYSNSYLLMAGSTNNMQSRIDNALVVATYADGTCDTLHIYNPVNWPTINEEYNFDDHAFYTAPVHPLRVRLDNGAVSRNINDPDILPYRAPKSFTTGAGSDVLVSSARDIKDGAATILKMPLNASRTLSSLRLVTLSNDVVIGLMSVTLEGEIVADESNVGVKQNLSKPIEMQDIKVSENHRFLQYADGKPFFWLGDTGWLLPQKLNREDSRKYLTLAAANGYNVVQVQTLCGVPCENAFDMPSNVSKSAPWDFTDIDNAGENGYWKHMDYIIKEAERHGIYIGMTCIWGGLVKSGLIDVEGAKAYGTFLANRYKDNPNIIWIIGGDQPGDVKPEVWNALATTIKSIDKRHLMTYHPRGRTTSARWWSKAPWIDFHMFQSGHRAYGQRLNNKTYEIPDSTEEDCWMYVDSTRHYFDETLYQQKYVKPVIDGEPSYEDIPIGLHFPTGPRWKAADVRRYAYWDVFAGTFGHTYGHNAIMQMHRTGEKVAYAETCKPWYEAQCDSGYTEMKYLKSLILSLPYFDRVADQSVIRNNGTRYNRLAATRGDGYILVYNYTLRPMDIDLSKLSNKKKNLWWMDATDGSLIYIGEATRSASFNPRDINAQHDGVLIIIDKSKNYIKKDQKNIIMN